VRDLGALLIHIGKRAEGLALLESYQSWIQGGRLLEPQQPESASASAAAVDGPPPTSSGSFKGHDAAGTSTVSGSISSVSNSGSIVYGSRSDAPGAYAGLVANVLLVQRRKALESAFAGEGLPPGPTEFMAQDLE